MAVKEESFYPSWFLQGWCQQSLHTCRDLSEISIMRPFINWSLLQQIQLILFICDGIFSPLAYGPFLFKHGVRWNAPSSFSGGYQEMARDGGLARRGLQSRTGEQNTYPEPRWGMVQIGREPWVPAPQLSHAESAEGTGVVLGRDGTGRECRRCWERSRMGTIKYCAKIFSWLIVVSFPLIAPPEIAG